MALVVADRVKETTLTTSTGTLTLAGAVTAFQSFAAIGNGNTTYYTIVGGNGTDWEVGIGTYTSSGTTLSRDTVLASSNSGSKINLSGTSTVFCGLPAERAVIINNAVQNILISASISTIIPLVVRGASSQSSNLQEWQNNGTTALAKISSAGIATFTGAGFISEFDNGNSGSAIQIDWSNGNYQKVTLNSANVAITFTNGNIGHGQLKIVQDGTGNRVITVTGSYTFGGTAPTLSTAPSSIDVIGVYFDGTNYFVGMSMPNAKVN